MEKVDIRAYGKVNIGLDITGRRDDGYHLLKTVMQTVNVYDEIYVSRRNKGIMMNTDRDYIPDDERNLAFKAAKLIKDKYKRVKGVQIDIRKHIPVGGGMAGGSTDAAAVIEACDRLFDLGMSIEDKDSIAVQIGADVPFCLRCGTWLAEGIGEKLTELKNIPEMILVTCTPDFPVSTKWAYSAFDEEPEQFHPDMDRLIKAIGSENKNDICGAMGNSLEPVVEKKYPQIKQIRKIFESAGSIRAMMSGSGSTVFGMFDDDAKADAACAALKKEVTGSEICKTRFIR